MNAQHDIRPQDVAGQLEATSQAALAAHEAHVRGATESVNWERRGWLRRLARVRPAPDRA